MIEQVGYRGDFVDFFDCSIEYSCEEEQYHIDACWEKCPSYF